jgi:hypothetical protein
MVPLGVPVVPERVAVTVTISLRFIAQNVAVDGMQPEKVVVIETDPL